MVGIIKRIRITGSDTSNRKTEMEGVIHMDAVFVVLQIAVFVVLLIFAVTPVVVIILDRIMKGMIMQKL